MLTLAAFLLMQAKVDQTAIDNAVDRGAKALLGAVGSGLPKVRYNVNNEHTFDELVFYTLVHAGVDPGDATFSKLLKRVVSVELKRTYEVSLIAMGLAALDPVKYQERIAECAQWLADQMCANGQWDYGMPYKVTVIPKPKDVATGGGEKSKTIPKIVVKKGREGNAVGDNSNTQYAAMGLRACAAAGCEFDKAIAEKAITWWEKSQLEDGSWNYCFQGVIKAEEPGYGSMTAGGVASLLIWNKLLGKDGKSTKSVKAGLDWLGKTFTLTENPKEPKEKRWQYYYIYALERVGDLGGIDKIGGHDWYPEGSTWLVEKQAGGMWYGPVNDFAIADTCFAILFLRRATKAPPKVATGK